MEAWMRLVRAHRPWVLAGLAGAGVGIVLWKMEAPPSSSPLVWRARPSLSAGLAPESKAVDFTLSSTAGEEVGLSALKGGPVGLVFVTARCPYCARLVARLEGFEPGAGWSLLIICSGSREEAQQLAQAHSLTFPVLVDSSGAVSQAYQVSRVPAVYLVDREGTIEAAASGWSSAWELVQRVRRTEEGFLR